MFSSSTLFTEAMKWSKPLISHKITTCLCVMLAPFQSSFKIMISSDSFINFLSKSGEQYHFREEEMDTEWVSPKVTQLTPEGRKTTAPPQHSACDTRLWSCGHRVPRSQSSWHRTGTQEAPAILFISVTRVWSNIW